ncbi:MAG TPA: hypothetical protein PLK05_09785 [Steroidobacteraceae bacterium]|nr:hypothetical protein [Steroidobacteraceae bacterium]
MGRGRLVVMAARLAAVMAGLLLLQSCGGGGDSGGMQPSPPPPSQPTTAQRTAAATQTAQSGTNACAPIRPFYWEVGDRNSGLASGSVNSTTDPTVYTVDTQMAIASASKWIYGAYVAQLRAGSLTDEDIRFLNFRSGYTSFSRCLPAQTVDECVAYQNNGEYHPVADGLFSYGGGHMEKHASLNGLGPLDNASLASEIRAKIGTDVVLGYAQPQLAGGIFTTAGNYARFLRKLLGGELMLGSLLGTHAVCTNPATCPQALNTPVPASESWNYSLGHWVEVDPAVGDGAFSSAGAFGFYPWIDASKTWYGIVARKQLLPAGQDEDATLGEGARSAQCGRLIRKAWVTAVAQ